MKNYIYVISICFAVFYSTESSARQNPVTGIKLSHQDSVTIISITSEKPAEYSHFRLKPAAPGDTEKIVVDINGGLYRIKEQKLQFSTGPVESIRSSQFRKNPNIVRIVADLRTKADAEFIQVGSNINLILRNYPLETAASPEKPKLNLRGLTIGGVIEAFMRMYDMNIIAARSVDRGALIDVMVAEIIDPEKLLETILIANEYKYIKRDNILLVTGRDAEIQGEMQHKILELQYIDGYDIVDKMNVLISKNGDIQVFSRSSMKKNLAAVSDKTDRADVLILYETPEKITEILRVIEQLDRPARQVFVNVRMIEIALGESEDWGVNWNSVIKAGIDSAAYGSGIPGGETENESSNYPQLTVENFKFGVISAGQYADIIRYIKSRPNSSLINQPGILVMENREARISIGEIIFTGGSNNKSGGNDKSSDLLPRNFTSSLTVIPNINENKYVSLYIRPEIKETLYLKDGDKQIPIEAVTSAETEVRVKNGGAVVISGMIKESRFTSKSKTKVLGSIPAMGKLFTRTEDKVERTELIIFIEPRIVPIEIK